MKKYLIMLALIMPLPASAFDIDVTYSWDSNPVGDQVTQYECEYSLNSGVYQPCTNTITPPVNSITQSITGVASGDMLTMHVRACNVVGCSDFTSGVSAIVPPNLVPGIPTNDQILPMVIRK